MTANELQWEEPGPSHVGNRRDFYAIVEQLKANPGSWALIAKDLTPSRASNLADYLRRRYQVEATQRAVAGVTRLYARWPE